MSKKAVLPLSLLLAFAAGDLTAQTCSCRNPQLYSVTANQASEIVQTWDLTNQTPAVVGSQFEQVQSNRHFGYSFTGIPFLCNPVLTIMAKPLNDSGNESISLQVLGSSYRWTSYFSTLVNGDWDSSSVLGWQTITLPLNNLPGSSVDLSMDLITTKLDVYVQDDTSVRSLTLSGQSCPGPGVSQTSCCGDGAIAWANSSHLFALHPDGNVKRWFWQGGAQAQWIQMAGNSPIVPGSFETLDDTAVLVVNEAGQVIKVSPAGSEVIPGTTRVDPCSLVVTSRGIFGARTDNGNVILIDKNDWTIKEVAPWGPPHWPVGSSMIEMADGRVGGVTKHGFPWNVWFDNGVMQWATMGEIGTVKMP